jgi:hypothetical protein
LKVSGLGYVGAFGDILLVGGSWLVGHSSHEIFR